MPPQNKVFVGGLDSLHFTWHVNWLEIFSHLFITAPMGPMHKHKVQSVIYIGGQTITESTQLLAHSLSAPHTSQLAVP